MENQLTLVPSEQLPVTDQPKKIKPKVNCLGEILRELLDELGIRDAEVVRETGISFSTYWGWATDDVACQLADQNLFKLWQFLNRYKRVPLSYLLYGVGDVEELDNQDEPA